MKKCLYCAEEIQDEAILCKHCGKKIKKKITLSWNHFRQRIKSIWHSIINAEFHFSTKKIFSAPKNIVSSIKRGSKIKLAVLFVVLLAGAVVAFFIHKNNYDIHFLLEKINVININQVKYTLNPTAKDTPLKSVVKVVVNENTDDEAWGSGILFTDDGYILTNAHVITNEFGKPINNIKICYINEAIKQAKCDYEARLIDSDYSKDLAVIKVDKKITEIKPYYFVVKEDEDSSMEALLDIGSKIKIVGFPGVGDATITVTEGIISGYKNHEWNFDNGSFHNVADYIKTDGEINFGNSGGAVFDQKNRYIGIPTYIKTDEGGKIGYVIVWNKINHYLKTLVYKGDINLDWKQYRPTKVKANDVDLHDGIKEYFKENYDLAKNKLEGYISKNSKGSTGLNYLCATYIKLEDYNQVKDCAEKLRGLNNQALATSWFYTSYFNTFKNEPDYKEAYSNIENALSIYPDSIKYLNWKTSLALDLDKISEAEDLNRKSIKLDSSNGTSWFYKGLIASHKGNEKEFIDNLEYSFALEKDADIAQYLADYYYDGKTTDDVIKSLAYSTASLSLGSNNPNNLFHISDLLISINSEADSVSSFVKEIKDTLNKINIDGEILNPIQNISDQKLINFIKEKEDIKDVSEEKLKNYRLYIGMVISWMHAFLQDGSCVNFKYPTNADDLMAKLKSLGFTKSESSDKIIISAVMQCVCESSDYSEDKMNGCFRNKLSTMCGGNKSFDSDSGSCVTADQACKNRYGNKSYASNDNMCYCSAGYDWNASGTSCVILCPANTFYSGGSCYCNTGYQLYKGSCVSDQAYCDSTYGYSSYWYNGDCRCLNAWKYYDWWGGLYCPSL